MTRWVLASSNAGKLVEFQHALAPVLQQWNLELIKQSDLGVCSPEEPFETFEENALVKARHASRITGLPALADDSGVCVMRLGGSPGVRSARYWRDALRLSPRAQAHAEAFRSLSVDEANLKWLLSEIRHHHASEEWLESDAEYRAAIAFVRQHEDTRPIVVTGVWPGKIIPIPRGLGGFGYDPVFLDPTVGLTAAEMTVAQKQSLSHRGRALRQLLDALAL